MPMANPTGLWYGHWSASGPCRAKRPDLTGSVVKVKTGQDNSLDIIVKLRQGSGKDGQGMALKVKGLKA